MSKSIYFYEVVMSNNIEVSKDDIDNVEIICAKKITYSSQNIIFIDVKTDGLKFSHTILSNFSKKNIEKFLLSKFSKIKLI